MTIWQELIILHNVTALTINKKAISDNLHIFSMKLLTKSSVKDNVNRKGLHLILYSFLFLFILGNIVTSQQELVILLTKTQQQLVKQHVHVYEKTD